MRLAAQQMKTPELARALDALKINRTAAITREDLIELYVRSARRNVKPKQKASATRRSAGGAARRGVPNTSMNGDNPMSWGTAAFILFAGVFIGSKFGGAPGGANGDDAPVDDSVGLGYEQFVADGVVREARTHAQFQGILEHHRTVTGVPVIVDFFSKSCGPCRMIAPRYKQLAEQYKGRAAFVKVNVQRNQQTTGAHQVSAMPTFIFLIGSKVVHRFAGADSNQLAQVVQKLVEKAERFGTFVGQEVEADALRSFYEEHDASKASGAAEALAGMAAKAGGVTPTLKILRMLQKKYKARPTTTARPTREELEAAASSAAAAEEADAHEGEEERAAEAMAAAAWPGPGPLPERLAIIGGGPAGLAAALYAARAGLRPVILAPPMGGQLQGKGVTVENYPGVLGGTGPSIVAMMARQAAAAGSFFEQQSVVSVDLSTGPPFTVLTNTTSFKTDSVIVATGADSRWLGVEGEHEYRGGGVSSCATCDGFLFKDQRVVVIGGGDTAMEDALVLARTSKSVLLIHRRDKFRASKVLAKRVLANAKITVRWDSIVTSFSGKQVATEGGDGPQSILSHVNIRHTKTGATEAYACAAAFVAIGHDPNTKMFQGLLEMDANGYLVTGGGAGTLTSTSVEGVFAAGDVADHVYRQAVTSAGTGAMAAMDVERWLEA